MRDLVRQIVAEYKSTRLEGQEDGMIQFTGQEPDTKQLVRIKILPRLLGPDPQFAARFRALAQTIRQLNHPNIASIRTVGEKAGLPFIVTRAIEKAQPLAAKLDQPWAVDAAADVVMQVGEALDNAYDKGLFHGSLTPQNIMVEDDGRVKVTDFGVSQLLEILGVQLKQAMSPYLAPERAAGKLPSPSGDVYSLGAILYRLLAGRLPQVVSGQVLPPSRFNPDVPPAMDGVVVKALAQNPTDRYPTIKSLLTALGAVTLVPAVGKAAAATASGRCPNCGARNQTGRFCRRCGAPLAQPESAGRPSSTQAGLREPIQVGQVQVGQTRVAEGRSIDESIGARPTTIATADLAALFPQPLEMPQVNIQDVWDTLAAETRLAMPEPLPMPVIDWAEAAPDMPKMPGVEES